MVSVSSTPCERVKSVQNTGPRLTWFIHGSIPPDLPGSASAQSETSVLKFSRILLSGAGWRTADFQNKTDLKQKPVFVFNCGTRLSEAMKTRDPSIQMSLWGFTSGSVCLRQVNEIYQDHSLGVSMNVVLVRIILLSATKVLNWEYSLSTGSLWVVLWFLLQKRSCCFYMRQSKTLDLHPTFRWQSWWSLTLRFKPKNLSDRGFLKVYRKQNTKNQ